MDLETAQNTFAKAVYIRSFEEQLILLSESGDVPGLLHLCLGAEVFEATLCSKLNTDRDKVTGSHRSHGIALAMGADPVQVAAEILGRVGGLSSGLGGTQHLLAPEKGFLSSNGIVGGQVPMAAGAALSAKTLGTGGIAVTFMGDGAFNQGAVSETMNLAVVLGLPLLFVVENNGLGQSTSSDYATAGTIISRARSYGMAAEYVDSHDIASLDSVTSAMTSWVRSNTSPALIEVIVPRLGGHYHGDKETYLGPLKPKDPLTSLIKYLIGNGLTQEDIDTVMSEMEDKAKVDIKKAGKMPRASGQLVEKWQKHLSWSTAGDSV